MLRLRPYKPVDADTIVSWCRDELSFRRWSSNRYSSWPITGADMNHKYMIRNGDCPEPDNFYPMTATDDSGIAGHLILRYTDSECKVLRFGFVIVDDSKRGRGYGKQMLLALDYAFRILKTEKVTLGVFDNNTAAYRCYRSVGFRDAASENPEFCTVCGECWKVLEMEMTANDYINNSKGEIKYGKRTAEGL